MAWPARVIAAGVRNDVTQDGHRRHDLTGRPFETIAFLQSSLWPGQMEAAAKTRSEKLRESHHKMNWGSSISPEFDLSVREIRTVSHTLLETLQDTERTDQESVPSTVSCRHFWRIST